MAQQSGSGASSSSGSQPDGSEATHYWQQLLDSTQEWSKGYFGLPGWVLMIILVVLLVLLFDLVCAFLLGRLERRLNKSPRRWDDALVHALRGPLRLWLWLGGLCSILTLGAQGLGISGITFYASLIFGLSTLAIIFWVEVRLMQRLEQRLVFPPAHSKAKPVDQTSASAITKITGALTLILVLLMALQMLGVSVSSLLAVGGAGGILIGFAARDVMANFFGGMVVHLDKPFQVGHWIRSPDREIEGMVEDIGWRLTRIRTFSGPPIYVPNAVFSRIIVETPSRMHVRLLWETIGIRYQDADKVEAITGDIAEMLEKNEDVENDEFITVSVSGYGEYSINIMVYALTKVVDWQQYNIAKQNILLSVCDIVYDHGAELAIPASRIHVPDEIRLGRPSSQTHDDATNTEEPDTDASREVSCDDEGSAGTRTTRRDDRELESQENNRQDGELSNSRPRRLNNEKRRNSDRKRQGPFDNDADSESDGDA
ncbi:mechanosensitive ion channel family protein [Kushneria konosiri]|uniref:Mechanosensitive ion channel protein MscS n=1 Tax=Kushneria konosiri TaxID=698828 RepID=A0A2Z2HED2_9GAMM|nr:mechanosensitive ion channel family protein [Kushneria konosiri]ARS53810.1 hypothetical protein B9G99_13820 [Kushneria konosiri]